jgi:hypothetical protein
MSALIDVEGSRFSRIFPALTLALLAPMLAEVLPGATRFSALFVYPIEVCVWGLGAVMIREIVRRRRLRWPSLLLLALVLAIAEEFVIQQTSLAPVVIQLKNVVYARAFGINYVYALWALVYETVFVVFLSISLAELLFPARKAEPWMSRAGILVSILLFAVGSLLAWYSWTQVARPLVFRVPLYSPTPLAMALAFLAMGLLVVAALGPARHLATAPAKPPSPWLLGLAGAVWATFWYGLCVLAFGIDPQFPPAAAVGFGLFLVVLILAVLPRYTGHPAWSPIHAHGLLFGTMAGAMTISFVGFLYDRGIDFWFKLAVDLVAIVLLAWLGLRLRRPPVGVAAAA